MVSPSPSRGHIRGAAVATLLVPRAAGAKTRTTANSSRFDVCMVPSAAERFGLLGSDIDALGLRLVRGS